MCGRYAATKDPAALAEEFEAIATPESSWAPSYNVAPTMSVPIVVDRELDGHSARTVEVARWGLVPSWAKDASGASRMINARVETAATKPAFRAAFARRRCLVPAEGYYEWYTPTDPDAPRGRSGAVVKQPFFIHAPDGGSLAMAGLYEWWRDPTRPEDSSEAWRLTCTILTTAASPALARIHDRMPVVLDRQSWSAWLDPSTGAEEASSLAHGAMSGTLTAYPVSTRVNNVRNDGPELLSPI